MTITTTKLTMILGAALFRAQVVARWAALLLACGSVVTVLVPVLPHAFERLLALPMGVALAALGFSLWSRPRSIGTRSDHGPHDARLELIGTR